MAIPQSFIDDLLERVDIVDVVGRYVTLKKGGANLLGLCPFHDEKSPSFTVSPAKQFYHCFGCGKNGDALRFLMEYTNVGFVDAVHDLAQRAGMQVPQEDISPERQAQLRQQKEARQTLAELNARAMQAYKKHLRQSPSTIQYLKNRGVSGEIAARYALGYAPAGEHSLASVFPDYADPKLEECGLVIFREDTNRRYDRFRDRLMFPIRNIRGECIGFGGRILGDGQPKYLNSPETPIFHKGRELYGLYEGKDAIHKAGYALVCEGYMDVIALAQWGFAQAVATLGTASGEPHVQTLFRHTSSIVFAFDGDNAGRKAAQKALECALPYVGDTRSVAFLFLPKEHDPDSFIRERGPQAFADYVQQAMPLSQYLLEVARLGCDLSTTEGRARMTHNARPLWSRLPQSALKIQLLDEIAHQAQMSAASLTQLWQPEANIAPAATAGASPVPGPANVFRQASGNRHGPTSPGNANYNTQDRPNQPDWPPAAPHNPASEPAAGNAARKNHQGRRPAWQQGGADFAQTWAAPRAAMPTRPRPISRDEQAICILLAHMPLLEGLAERDLHTLRKLSPPAGEIFGWLEDQYMQNGVQPWASLLPALETSAHQPAIERLRQRIDFAASTSEPDATAELQSTLLGITEAQIRQQLGALEKEFGHNPEARTRMQTLLAQLAELERARRK